MREFLVSTGSVQHCLSLGMGKWQWVTTIELKFPRFGAAIAAVPVVQRRV